MWDVLFKLLFIKHMHKAAIDLSNMLSSAAGNGILIESKGKNLFAERRA